MGTPSVRRLRLEHDDLGFLEEAARLLGFQVQKFLGLLKLHSPMQIHCDQCKAMGDLLLVNTLPPQPRWRYNR